MSAQPRCTICGQFMSDDDVLLGFTGQEEWLTPGGNREAAERYAHGGCVVKWKDEPDRKVSYLYFNGKLMGLVRDWGNIVFIQDRDPWSAYSNADEVQTYHKTESEAKKELERRCGVKP